MPTTSELAPARAKRRNPALREGEGEQRRGGERDARERERDGPSAGTATRMNTNEPPHSAASVRSSAGQRGGIGHGGRYAPRSRSSSFCFRASPPP